MVVDASDHWSECSFGLFEALNHLYRASRSSPLATPTEGPGDLCGWVLVFPESFQIVLSEVGLYRQKRERHNPEDTGQIRTQVGTTILHLAAECVKLYE